MKHSETRPLVEIALVWMMFITAYGMFIFEVQVTAGDFVTIPSVSDSVGLDDASYKSSQNTSARERALGKKGGFTRPAQIVWL